VAGMFEAKQEGLFLRNGKEARWEALLQTGGGGI
jgi:hypothetical protein